MIQQYAARRVGADDNQYYGSFSSSGNFGTLPPSSRRGHDHPVGRVLTAGPRGGWGWQVRVTLPLPRTTAADRGPRDRRSPASEETTAV